MLCADLCFVESFSREKKMNRQLFQMETTRDLNSDISNMDGLKFECFENTIAFVGFS